MSSDMASVTGSQSKAPAMESASVHSKKGFVSLFTVIGVLLVGGMLTFYEVSGRSQVLFGVGVDGLRNLVLVTLAVLTLFLITLQNNFRQPSIMRIMPYLIFTAWGFLSISWSIAPYFTLRDLLKLVYPIVLFMLGSLVCDTEENAMRLYHLVYRVLMWFCIFSVAVAGLIIARGTLDGSWHWGVSRVRDMPFIIRPELAIVYINWEIASRLRIDGWKLKKWLVAAMLAYVLLTLTRSVIFAAVASFSVLVWVTWQKPLLRQLAPVAGIVLVLLLIGIDNPIKSRMFMQPDEVTILSFVETAVTEPQMLISPQYIRVSGRFTYWRYLLGTAHTVRPPLMGSGLGTARKIMSEGTLNISGTSSGYAHGDFAKYLAELGYIGLFAILALYTLTFIWAYRIARCRSCTQLSRASAAIITTMVTTAVIVGMVYEIFWSAFSITAIAILLVAILESDTVRRNAHTNTLSQADMEETPEIRELEAA